MNLWRQKVDSKLPETRRRQAGSYFSMGTVSVWDDEKILGMNGGDGCTTL